MNQRFIMFRRGAVFYCEDTETGQQLSLRTRDKAAAGTLLHAKNESLRQPVLNRQIARAYLTGCDPQIAQSTWQEVMDEIPKLKNGSTCVFRGLSDTDSNFCRTAFRFVPDTVPIHIGQRSGLIPDSFRAPLEWCPSWPGTVSDRTRN